MFVIKVTVWACEKSHAEMLARKLDHKFSGISGIWEDEKEKDRGVLKGSGVGCDHFYKWAG